MMTLEELRARVSTDIEDASLQVKLDDAIDFVEGYLNQSFDDDNPMSGRVKRIIAKYVHSELSFDGAEGVKSESLAGMSQTFESREERDSAFKSLLRATRLRKLSW